MIKVVITLGKDGSIKKEVFGAHGPVCKEKAKFLDELYGEPVETELKPEYYEGETESETICDQLPNGYCG